MRFAHDGLVLVVAVVRREREGVAGLVVEAHHGIVVCPRVSTDIREGEGGRTLAGIELALVTHLKSVFAEEGVVDFDWGVSAAIGREWGREGTGMRVARGWTGD